MGRESVQPSLEVFLLLTYCRLKSPFPLTPSCAEGHVPTPPCAPTCLSLALPRVRSLRCAPRDGELEEADVTRCLSPLPPPARRTRCEDRQSQRPVYPEALPAGDGPRQVHSPGRSWKPLTDSDSSDGFIAKNYCGNILTPETSTQELQALRSARPSTSETPGSHASEHVGQRLPLAAGLLHHLLQVQRVAQLLPHRLLLPDGLLQRPCGEHTRAASQAPRGGRPLARERVTGAGFAVPWGTTAPSRPHSGRGCHTRR